MIGTEPVNQLANLLSRSHLFFFFEIPGQFLKWFHIAEHISTQGKEEQLGVLD